MTKTCLITGATGGLGRVFAKIAAAEGHRLILSARSSDALKTLAAEVQPEAILLPADLAQPGTAKDLWAKATEHGEIAVLINNAGLGQHGLIHDESTWPQDDATLMVNAVSAADLMKCAAVDMAAKGRGRILNVASSAAFMPGPQMGRYHATKAFLLNLSEAASADLKGTGVTVTALCPGPTDTGFFDAGDVNGALALKLLPKASAGKIARSGWRAMMCGKPVHIPGLLYKLVAFSMRLIPRRLATAIARLYWRK